MEDEVHVLPKPPMSIYEMPDFNRVMKDMHKSHGEYVVAAERQNQALHSALAAATRRSTALTKDNTRMQKELEKKMKGKRSSEVESLEAGEGEEVAVTQRADGATGSTANKAMRLTTVESKSLEVAASSLTNIAKKLNVKIHGVEEIVVTNYVAIIKVTVEALSRKLNPS
jgi:hypothetical protein